MPAELTINERITMVESDLDTRIARIDNAIWLAGAERSLNVRSVYKPTNDDFLAVERNMVRKINQVWRENVSESMKDLVEMMDGINQEVSEEMISQIILPYLDVHLAESFYSDPDLRKTVKASIQRTYRLSKAQIAKEVGVKLAGTSAIDEQAKTWLQLDTRFWLRHQWETHIRERIQDTARKIGIEQGLGRREVGRAMASAFKGVCGESAYYWEVVGSATVTRGRSWSNLTGFQDAGIRKNIWQTVGDERVCLICGPLDGTEFYTQDGIDLMKEAMAETNLVAVRNITPWINYSTKVANEGGSKPFYWSEHNAKGEITRKHFFGAEKLKDGKFLTGVGMTEPQAHGGCRCRKVAA